MAYWCASFSKISQFKFLFLHVFLIGQSLTYAYLIPAIFVDFSSNYFLQDRFKRMRDLVTERTGKKQISNLYISPRGGRVGGKHY